MNPILQSKMQGYDDDEILDYVVKAIPALSSQIKKAKSLRYPTSQILDFLSKTMDGEEFPEHMSIPKRQMLQREKNNRLTGQLLKMGASAGGGLLAGRALSNVAPQLSSLLSRRGMPQTPGGMAQEAPPQDVEAATPPLPKLTPKDFEADLERLQLKSKADRLLARNPPEILGGLLFKQISPEQKDELENKYGKAFGTLLTEYGQNYLQKAKEKPLSRESLAQQFNQGEMAADERIPEESQEKEPSSKMAVLPDGKVGNIVEERQGIASVQLPSGTIRRQKLSDLDVESPEVEEFLTALKDTIPEEERSTAIGFASYNAPNKMLALQFPSGDFYVYPEATEDQFKKIVSNATLAKTTGETWRGVWTQGEKSRGAGMSQVLKELKETFGDNFIKFSVKEGYEYPLTTLIREIEKRIERKRRKGKR